MAVVRKIVLLAITGTIDGRVLSSNFRLQGSVHKNIILDSNISNNIAITQT
jgi:hypothetical protein